jgi:hypothetical protein
MRRFRSALSTTETKDDYLGSAEDWTETNRRFVLGPFFSIDPACGAGSILRTRFFRFE